MAPIIVDNHVIVGTGNDLDSPGFLKSYDPETVWSYEAGAKTTFWDGKARANFDVFYNDYKDFQARVGGRVWSFILQISICGPGWRKSPNSPKGMKYASMGS